MINWIRALLPYMLSLIMFLRIEAFRAKAPASSLFTRASSPRLQGETTCDLRHNVLSLNCTEVQPLTSLCLSLTCYLSLHKGGHHLQACWVFFLKHSLTNSSTWGARERQLCLLLTFKNKFILHNPPECIEKKNVFEFCLIFTNWKWLLSIFSPTWD